MLRLLGYETGWRQRRGSMEELVVCGQIWFRDDDEKLVDREIIFILGISKSKTSISYTQT